MNHSGKKYRANVIVPALRIALLFFVVSALWVFFSDQLLAMLSSNKTDLVFWQLIKGWGFVLSFGVLLFLLVRKILRTNYQLNTSLSRSRSHYKTIIEKTLTGIVVIDDQGIIQYVNPAFCRIFNFRPHEILKHHFNTIVPPEEHEARLKVHHNFFHNEGEVNGFYNVVNKEGDAMVVYVDGVGIENNEGHWQQLLFMSDVTTQRQTENKLAESERRYRVMMESLHEPVIITDNDFHIVYANRAFKERFGNPPPDVPCYKFVFGKDEPSMIRQSHRPPGVEKSDFQFEDKRTGRIFRITYIPLEGYGDGQLGMTILLDQTDIINARKKAEESDQLKSSFLANMSHEIRTPLNSILGFSGLLLDDQITNDERISFVGLINQSGRQLLKVIDDIIDYSFIESGNIKLKPTVVSIKQLVAELMQYAHDRKEHFQKKDVELVTNINLPYDYQFYADFGRLKQVFVNILDNALKFTDRGTVSLSVTLNKSQLKFVIADTGIGISKEKQAVVFERFRQEDEALSRGFGGSGLGLPISKNLVELMGGTIKMVSSPGSGTHFEVRMPLVMDFSKN